MDCRVRDSLKTTFFTSSALHGHRFASTEFRLTRSLLFGDTEGLASTAGGLGLLTTNLYAEVVTETSVLAGLLHALQIFSESGVDHVGNQLTVGAILNATLSVEEPLGNTVLCKTR